MKLKLPIFTACKLNKNKIKSQLKAPSENKDFHLKEDFMINDIKKDLFKQYHNKIKLNGL